MSEMKDDVENYEIEILNIILLKRYILMFSDYLLNNKLILGFVKTLN